VPQRPTTVVRTADETRERTEAVLFEIRRVIVGQDAMLERVLVSLLAGGHVLLEGVPGLAKTLTIKTLADVLGGTFRRIQFTPDLVPADLVGTRIFRPDHGEFDTELGPVFANLVLADEINRAPAKVQSALLEVMQEHQVTIGRTTFRVPEPFLVLATQNPIESEGTYPLPEAQVDRFLMKVLLGYPSLRDEREVVARAMAVSDPVDQVLTIEELITMQQAVRSVYVDPRALDYAVTIVAATRRPADFGLAEIEPFIEFGASPRGSIGLIAAARARAFLHGRRYVIDADLSELAPDVLRHRVVPSFAALAQRVSADQILARILSAVPVPQLQFVEELSA
jgi:MoxR-like ATPase